MALPSTDRDSAERRFPVEFTAGAGEYFRIWIVNLALTIVTLGVYSAWAKVRRSPQASYRRRWKRSSASRL